MSNLKTVTLELVKKNRVYFACKNGKYDAKLKITEESENLPLGKHELLVEDVSPRSKYGVDVIYVLKSDLKNEKIVTLQHRYNSELVESCRKLGGRWDAAEKIWVFSGLVENEVEELDFIYNSNVVIVDITAHADGLSFGNAPAEFLGYPLARATSRDSGARLCDAVILLNGNISSGGSAKYWATRISGGSKFRLKISKNLLEKQDLTETSWLIEEKD